MDRLMKIKEVAGLIGEDPATVYKRVRSGEITSIRVGRRGVRITESELCRWLGIDGENAAGTSAIKGE